MITEEDIRRYRKTLLKMAKSLGFSEAYLKTLTSGEIQNLITDHEKFRREPIK